VKTSRFWRLGTLGDTRVFLERHKVNGIEAAASVLVDSSESMEKILHIALDVALAFSQALQRLGVKTKVTRFPGAGTLCETLLMFNAYHANIIMPNKNQQELSKVGGMGKRGSRQRAPHGAT
jgi:hypothetical protein